MLGSKKMVAEFDASIVPFQRKIDDMKAGTERFRRETQVGFGEVDKNATRAALSLGKVFAATTALGGSAVLLAIARYGDTAKQMGNQLQAIGAGADDMKEKVFALAIETRTPIEATVGLLRSMQKSLKDQSLEDTIRQVGTLNRLLTIGGLDGASRGSVSLQFGQALQSGILAGDELRSLREAAPIELLEAIARAAGGTVEGLRKLGSEGKLTRDVMVKALADLEETSKIKFQNFRMTLSEASDALRTSFVAVAGELDKGAGVTDRIAGAQQALAEFMLRNAGAAGELGKALKIVFDAALVLAGTRGLLMLGGVAASIASRMTLMSIAAGTAGTALAGLNGALALFGGPWGAALFAAGTAMLALSRNAKTTAERIQDVAKAVAEAKTASDEYAQTRKDIETDLDSLEKAERRVEQAIKDQMPAVEATARAEVAAISRRIEANKELAALQEAANESALSKLDSSLQVTYESLIADARRVLQRAVDDGENGATPEGNRKRAEIAGLGDEEVLDRAKSFFDKGGRNLDERETALLNNLRDYIAQREKADAELLRQAIARETRFQNSRSGFAQDRQQQAAAFAKAAAEQAAGDKAILDEYAKGTAKLELLEKQRSRVFEKMNEAVLAGNEEAAAKWLSALEKIDMELEKTKDAITTPQESIADLIEKVRSARELVEAIPVDKSGQARDVLQAMERRLAAAVEAGEDLDALKLARLTGQFQGVLSMVNDLLASLNLVGKSAAEIELDFSVGGTGGPRRGGYRRDEKDRVFARNADEASRRGILDLIGYAEGTDKGRGYNETLGYGKFTGGDVNLTSMTLREILALQRQMLRHPDNHYNSSALGRYQIVGRTLGGPGQTGRGGLIRELGLSLDEQFTPELQDRLAMQLVRRRQGQGVAGYRNEWEGLRRVSSQSIQTALGAQVVPTNDRNVARNLERENEARKEAARLRKDFITDATTEAERRELEAELIGKTAGEQAYLVTKFNLLARAKRDNIDLDEKAAGSAKTYREQIEELAKAAQADADAQENRAQALENAEARTAFLEQANATLKDGILDAIIEGENFADVLENVAKMLARAALEAALFGEGPFASGGGGGGGLGNLFSGFGDFFKGLFTFSANGNVMTGQGPVPLKMYSQGGIANSPQLSVFGEGSTPEAYVPLPDGRSIPVTLNMPDLARMAATPMHQGAGGGGGLSVHIHENAVDGDHQVSHSPENGRVDIMLRRQVANDIEGGAFDKSMGRRFGVKPTAKGG